MDHVLSSPARPPLERPGLVRRLLRALSMHRSRHRLGTLDDRLLRDIGLTRSQARIEAQKVSWDAPSHWLR